MRRPHKAQKKSPLNQIKIVPASQVSPKVYFAACMAEAIRSNAQRAKEDEANRSRIDQAIREHYEDTCKQIAFKKTEELVTKETVKMIRAGRSFDSKTTMAESILKGHYGKLGHHHSLDHIKRLAAVQEIRKMSWIWSIPKRENIVDILTMGMRDRNESVAEAARNALISVRQSLILFREKPRKS
jgi:hypothetical protein